MREDWGEVEAEVAPLLVGLPGVRLDRERLEDFAEGIAAGRYGPQRNTVSGELALAPARAIDALADLDPRDAADLRADGAVAIRAGKVAVVVLNGGMATRFGGDVKGILEAVGGRSFLEIKLAEARAQGPVPFLAMNSFATEARTARFLAERGLAGQVETFVQNVSLRLTPEGELFRSPDGALSLYAPGHGDLPEALRRCGALERLRERGVEVIQLSNIDNLGAGLDPLLVGWHRAQGRPISAEVAPTRPGDVGGAPATVDGVLQIVEGFRFPADFDPTALHQMATNTFWFDLEVLAEPRELSWFYVTKQVDGMPCVQMEHLVNELTRFWPTAWAGVSRSGADSRFVPIKTREDLAALRADRELAGRWS